MVSLSGNSGISVSRASSSRGTAAGAHDTAASRAIANHTDRKTTSTPTTKSNPYAGTVSIGGSHSSGGGVKSGGTNSGSSALSTSPANYLASHGGGIASLIQRNIPASYQMFVQESKAESAAKTTAVMNAERAASNAAMNAAWMNAVLPAEQKTLSLINQGKSSSNQAIRAIATVNDIALPTAFMEYDIGKRTGSMTQEELDDPINKGFAAFDLLASIPIVGTVAGLIGKGAKAVGKGIEKAVKVFGKTGDDAAEAVTKGVTKTADDAAEAAGKSAKTADNAAELAAKSNPIKPASKALATTSAGLALTGASLMLANTPQETPQETNSEAEPEEEEEIIQPFFIPYIEEWSGGGAENPAEDTIEESYGGFGSRPDFSAPKLDDKKTLLILLGIIAAAVIIAAAAASRKKTA